MVMVKRWYFVASMPVEPRRKLKWGSFCVGPLFVALKVPPENRTLVAFLRLVTSADVAMSHGLPVAVA